MGKLKQILICLVLFVFGILIWCYKMIITSDIPLNVSFKELVVLFIMLLIYTSVQYFYIKRLKSNLFFLNSILSIILLLLWLGNMITALIYKYHIYDTISNIAGFMSIIIIIIEVFTYKFKDKINY